MHAGLKGALKAYKICCDFEFTRDFLGNSSKQQLPACHITTTITMIFLFYIYICLVFIFVDPGDLVEIHHHANTLKFLAVR